MTLTELSIKRPSFVAVIFIVLGVLGLLAFAQLRYELLPKFSNPIVTITAFYPGASPNEVETTVSKPIEDGISGIDKIKTVRTTSGEGVSLLILEFEQGVNPDIALQDVQRKVNTVAARFPEDVVPPVFGKFAPDEFPILRVAVTSSLDDRQLYQLMKDRLKPRISQVAGVGDITILGGQEREIGVNIDPDRLRSSGLSLAQVVAGIKGSNLDFPTGNVKAGDAQFVVRVAGKFTSVDEIRSLIVGKSRSGGDIKLADVADVVDGVKEGITYSRLNGKSTLSLLVLKQTDANAVDVARLVRAQMVEIEKEYKGQEVKFEVAQDLSNFTLDAAKAVQEDLLIAVILVAIVMLVFLHSLRNSFIVMVAIPASLVSTFIVMWVFGFSLNLMTLLGLSLVIGILVDDSIVVLENIYRRLEMGDDKQTAALVGRNEIGFTALSITLVDVVVFLPLSLVSGLIGNIMREFAIVVVASTMMSLFVSFTITPALASRLSKLQPINRKTVGGWFSRKFEAGFNAVNNLYGAALAWTLRRWWHGALVAVGTFVLFVSSIALVVNGYVGGEFITQSDRGEFAVTVELPPGTSLDSTNAVSRQLEDRIMRMPELYRLFVSVGTNAEGGLPGQQASNSNSTELSVTLIPKEQRTKSTDEIGEEIKQMALEIPGAKARVNPIGIFGGANQSPLQFAVQGPDDSTTRVAATRIAAILDSIPGTVDVRLSSQEGNPETHVRLDREKMASLGLSVAEVGGMLRVALSGDDQAKYTERGSEYDIRVRLDQSDRSRTEDLASMPIVNRAGQQIELRQFATIERSSGPTKLQRKDRASYVQVLGNVLGRPSGSINNDFQAALAKEKLPTGVVLSPDGDVKNQQEAGQSMGLALMVGILFVYLIMVALYNSWMQPFIVLFSIPLAMIGAFYALGLTAKTLNIFSGLGIIMLMGLVAKNAILLVDFANREREEGKPLKEALLAAGRERLRPILMTTLTMILGMMPIALSHASGAEWKSGLAWALIGGLTSSMFLTLVVVPLVYLTMESMRGFLGRLFGGRKRKSKPQTLGSAVTAESAS